MKTTREYCVEHGHQDFIYDEGVDADGNDYSGLCCPVCHPHLVEEKKEHDKFQAKVAKYLRKCADTCKDEKIAARIRYLAEYELSL